MSKTRHRVFGIIFLVAALAMLTLGLTVLEKHRLAALPMLIYWLVCFALTCGAMIVALRDLRAIRHETTDKHRDLLKEIAHEIEDEAKRKEELKRQKEK